MSVPLGIVVAGCVGAGLATGVGALPVLFFRRISERVLDGLLGAAAGVMLAASCFSLIIPAIEDPLGGPWRCAAGILLGAAFLAALDRLAPHLHLGSERHEGLRVGAAVRRAWLFFIAVTIHNLPEGAAVGIGYGSGDAAAATALAVGIGLQNMPEGLAVAMPLRRAGYGRAAALGYAALSGGVEPVLGLLAYLTVGLVRPVQPWGLAFAAGAMLYVVLDEILPERRARGHEMEASWGAVTGFVVMMLLDNLVG